MFNVQDLVFKYLIFDIYLERKRKQASMRLGPVGIEELLGSSRSDDPLNKFPKPLQKSCKIVPKPFQNPPQILPKFTLGALLGPLSECIKTVSLQTLKV